jgi:hypothetical protein
MCGLAAACLHVARGQGGDWEQAGKARRSSSGAGVADGDWKGGSCGNGVGCRSRENGRWMQLSEAAGGEAAVVLLDADGGRGAGLYTMRSTGRAQVSVRLPRCGIRGAQACGALRRAAGRGKRRVQGWMSEEWGLVQPFVCQDKTASWSCLWLWLIAHPWHWQPRFIDRPGAALLRTSIPASPVRYYTRPSDAESG